MLPGDKQKVMSNDLKSPLRLYRKYAPRKVKLKHHPVQCIHLALGSSLGTGFLQRSFHNQSSGPPAFSDLVYVPFSRPIWVSGYFQMVCFCNGRRYIAVTCG